ncbi:RNA polymerase sigma factor [Homoserinimonas sp. OAct 916]|uniref:RNA polymerase sigma factor n=1 Tax=Homoserinimonas sp. OAct 916 TaxID=2211450 RepID=UPI000DBE569B|nr:sigma-70 family RNA polymerase sigma factor [Homoserinimonas sp. OAct 916]
MKTPFDVIVAQHAATVWRVCRAVLGVHTDADDAWSETFLSALQAWPNLPEDANVEAWLVTIARRKAIDVIRFRKRHAITVDELPERHSPHGIPGRVDLDLWAAIAALPEKQRNVVAYHHLAGIPYTQVAEIIGGTVEAARRAGSDAIRSLRGTIQPGAIQPGAIQPGAIQPRVIQPEDDSKGSAL